MKVSISHHSVSNTMSEYESLHGDKNAYVCVTSWSNGEGVDVELNETGCHCQFQMTHDQWVALRKTMKAHLNRSESA